jgi:hypothetical protein
MGDAPKCKAKVWDTRHSYPCARDAKRDGYCTIHHPETIAKRRAKSQSRWEAQRLDEQRARNERARDTVREFLSKVAGQLSERQASHLHTALESWEREPMVGGERLTP